jgi:serine protease inhibitor
MSDNGQMEALKQLREQYDCMTKGKISSKDGIFLDNSFQPKADFYKKVRYSGANMYKVDFARQPDMSRIILDSWISDGKESPIGLPRDSVSSATSLMMLSSTTFEAKWAVEFNERYPGGFLLPDGKTKMVDMMVATYPMQHVVSCIDFPNYEDCNPNKSIPTMVQIPLESTRLQVVALKPNKVMTKQAIVALSPEYFHGVWLPASDSNLKTCKLRIPQVDIESQFDLSNSLYGLGIEDAFIPFKANFSKMTDNQGISLSNIYQSSFLKWDKTGAAAGVAKITTIKLPYSARSGQKEMHDHEISFDEPFVVFITDRVTKTNLFVGVVNDPR